MVLSAFFLCNTSFWLHSKHSVLLKLHLNFHFGSILAVLVCIWLLPNKVNWLNKIQIFPYSFHIEHILSFFDMLCIICTEFAAYIYDEFKFFGIICSSFKPGSQWVTAGYVGMGKPPDSWINLCLLVRSFTKIFSLKKFMYWCFERWNKLS